MHTNLCRDATWGGICRDPTPSPVQNRLHILIETLSSTKKEKHKNTAGPGKFENSKIRHNLNTYTVFTEAPKLLSLAPWCRGRALGASWSRRLQRELQRDAHLSAKTRPASPPPAVVVFWCLFWLSWLATAIPPQATHSRKGLVVAVVVVVEEMPRGNCTA